MQDISPIEENPFRCMFTCSFANGGHMETTYLLNLSHLCKGREVCLHIVKVLCHSRTIMFQFWRHCAGQCQTLKKMKMEISKCYSPTSLQFPFSNSLFLCGDGGGGG